MTPAGRARICASCDKAVHDLSRFTLEEAEALARRDTEVCVRARIGADGAVKLKPGRRGDTRRMVIAAAATAGLLATAAPAYAKKDRPPGAIAGHVRYGEYRTRVSAKGADGQVFRTRMKRKGGFRIRYLPAGTYTLTFEPACGQSWTIDDVEVGTAETVLPNIEAAEGCIVVGMLKVVDSQG